MGTSSQRLVKMTSKKFFAVALLVICFVAIGCEAYGSRNRDCPIRNKTIKKGIVIPQECRALKGTWLTSWQKCGTACTRNYKCKAWTFTKGWCAMYEDALAKCKFTAKNGRGTTAGYSGCEA